MSKYVFTAFDFRGRVEIIRLMFVAAGVKVNGIIDPLLNHFYQNILFVVVFSMSLLAFLGGLVSGQTLK